jgi:hypothetical protein
MSEFQLCTLRSFTKTDVIESWQSLIWTERYSAWGDFTLVIPSTPKSRKLLTNTTRLALNQSNRVMVIETLTDAIDDDGARMLTATGRSFETILEDRVAMPAVASLTATPKWVLTGIPGDIARLIFTTVCVSHSINVGDGIPGYTSGTLLPHGSIPEPADVVTISLDPATVYTSVKAVCDVYNLGFRIVVDFNTSKTYFEVYTGEDRTSDQLLNEAVIFSKDLDNFKDQTILQSTANVKNVAYVYAQNGALAVYAPNTSTTVNGATRRALYVDASDIDTAAGSALTLQLTQRGLQELSQYQKVYMFDGQISEYSKYVYGVDYNLGDIIEERDDDGNAAQLRVTEQIFVSDAEGDRSYPTLSLNTIVTPGTWASWTPGETWSEQPPTEFWANAQDT